MLEAIFSLNTLWWVCTLIWFPSCIGLILVVLMQKGKGAGFSGAFGGGGGSDTVFGPRARKSLPVRLTYGAAALFMVLSLLLSLIVGRINAGVAPDTVDEDAAAVATSNALDDLFGGKTPAEASDAATPLAPSADTAPPATPEAAPESTPAAEEPAPEAASTPAEPAPEAASTPAESAPAPAGQ